MTKLTLRPRLQVEALEDRNTPSSFGSLAPAAFSGLDVAVSRFHVGPPIAPVFTLNYGSGSEALPALDGLVKVGVHGPPISPVFFGLANDTPPEGGVDFDAPPALFALTAALDRVGGVGPSIRVAPVFALNFGDASPETIHALDGLVKAGYQGPPISPVFYGLADDGATA